MIETEIGVHSIFKSCDVCESERRNLTVESWMIGLLIMHYFSHLNIVIYIQHLEVIRGASDKNIPYCGSQSLV